jgi:hypothetical protein
MPLDFRYHLASLTAVFGALLIGILVGVAMKEGPAFSRQITQLRAEFKRSESLREIDAHTDRFNTRMERALVRGRLLGRNVALVVDAAAFPAEQVEAVEGTLRQSGATVVTTITLKPSLLQLTSEQLAAVYLKLGTAMPAKAGPGELVTRLAADLGVGQTTIARVLHEKKLIRVEGNPALPLSTVVLLGGGAPKAIDGSVQRVDLPFLRGCGGRQLRLAAVEPFDIELSAISAYKNAANVTIDNIDRAAGRIALVLALSRDLRGDFGYKKTADDVAPEVE